MTETDATKYPYGAELNEPAVRHAFRWLESWPDPALVLNGIDSAYDPDGEFALDWWLDDTHVMSISFSAGGKISYAYRRGSGDGEGHRGHGTYMIGSPHPDAMKRWFGQWTHDEELELETREPF